MESSSLQELEQIPGVGKTIARDIGRTGRIRNNLLLTGSQKQPGAETLHDIRNTICEVRNSLTGIAGLGSIVFGLLLGLGSL